MKVLTKPALLALGNGEVFYGESIGATGAAVGEVVFNTAMTGYVEILTDPSYARQIVLLTAPHIGNTGVSFNDEESGAAHAAGLVIRDLALLPSNWRMRLTLPEYLARKGVVAIAGIDTRRLTRVLRDQGAQSGCIIAGGDMDSAATAKAADKAIGQARAFVGLAGMDLAKVVSTTRPYTWDEGLWQAADDRRRDHGAKPRQRPRPSPCPAPLHIVAYDFGVKRNILRMLVARGCRVTVVPATTSATRTLSMNPDGVFLSNGPGDPQPCDYAIAAIREMLKTPLPLFGICLGYQLLALAAGGETIKMKFGHHGANHPVQDLSDGRVMITSQNHGFAVADDLPDCLRATHVSLFDGSLQGITHTSHPAFGFQGHPEASPGPHDATALFDRFIAAAEAYKKEGENAET